VDRTTASRRGAGWFDELLLGRVLERELVGWGLDPTEARRTVSMIRLLLELDESWPPEDDGSRSAKSAVARLVASDAGRELLGVNRHAGVLWYRAEGFDEVVALLHAVALLECWEEPGSETRIDAILDRIKAAGARSGYRVEQLIEALEER
jgi:hypothetical protein